MSTLVHPRHTSYTLAAVVGAIAVALSLAGLLVLRPEGSSTDAVQPAPPAWFAPVADYYGHDPKVTPSFQFADLFTAEPAWFRPIAAYYHSTPGVTSTFDFAALYGSPAAEARP
jgi:hypothetical protein